MKKALLTSIISILSVLGYAQPYTNNWIDYSQTYFKLPVAETGIYRITKTELEAAGVPVSVINPKNIQLIYRGVEQALYINGEDDGTWDNGDYLEFYGEKNDGVLDADLYEDKTDQPHQYYSLYNDTSAYFLTWSTTQGKRYTSFFESNYGSYTKQPYYIHKSLLLFTDAYWDGSVYADYALYSQYTDGEGWFTGLLRRLSNPYQYTLNTPGYTGTGPTPTISARLFGKSDAVSADPDGYNHHFMFDIGTDTLDYKEKGYFDLSFTRDLKPENIGATTKVKLRFLTDIAAATDYMAMAYLQIEYARNFDLQNQSNREFNFNGGVGLNTYIQFTNYDGSAPKPYIYDATNKVRIECTQNGTTLDFIVPNNGVDKTLILTNDDDYKTISGINPISFTQVDPSNDYDMIIITNNKLLTAVNDYAAYKQTRGFNPLVITVDQLYNQFYYGVNYHPLAIRHFCDYIIRESSTAPEYLLLIGKGQTNDLMRQSSLSLSQNLVPTIGFPPTDYFFTSGLNGTALEPAIATGRIPASNNNQVYIYLNKVKEFDSRVHTLGDKNLLHLGGGRNEPENNKFKAYLESFTEIAVDSLFGAHVSAFYKDDAIAGEKELKKAIIDIIDNDISQLTYFGHGAADVLEIDIGVPSDLSNQGKYPNMLFSGCILGNTFADGSLCEDYIFEPNAGAITWMANSSYGFPEHLRRFTASWYTNLYVTHYGESLGNLVIKTLKEMQTDQSALTLLQVPQITFHGDPSLVLYSPNLPDYFVQNKNAYISTPNATALMDSLDITIIINNKGKATTDSLDVQLKRTLPNNTSILYPIKTLAYIPNTGTVNFRIPGGGPIARGTNTFEITIDPDNKLTELTGDGELNNKNTFTHFLPSNGVDILEPRRNSVVNNINVTLKVQSSDLFTKSAEYIFEMDTTSKFNSPYKTASGTITSNVTGEWAVTLLPTDSTTYYWRARLNIPVDKGGVWQEGAFTYIINGKNGWHQGHFDQIKTISLTSIGLDTNSKQFNFLRTTSDIHSIITNDVNGRSYMRVDYLAAPYAVPLANGFSIMAINPDDMSRYREEIPFNRKTQFQYSGLEDDIYYKQGNYSCVYQYVTTNAAQLDSLVALINRIPEGYHVMIHNAGAFGIDNWGSEVFEAFESFGATKIRTQLKEEDPYVCFGLKGAAPGTATEKFADPTSPVPTKDQNVTGFAVFYPLKKEGSFESELIGPSKKWGTFYSKFVVDDTSDLIGIEFLGLDSANNFVTVEYTEDDTIDLSSIDASKYRYLKLIAYVEDIKNLTPAQLSYWGVTYEDVPEGTIQPELAYNFYNSEIQEGDSIKITVAYQNISSIDMDSVLVEIKTIDEQRNEKLLSLLKYPPLLAGDWFKIDEDFSTIGYTGANKLQVTVNPNAEQPEQILANNIVIEPFVVTNDKINPILDVVFDGQHIMNDQIISPNPNIIITAVDENKYLFIDDTSDVMISIRYPDKNNFERVYFNRSDIVFTPANADNKKAKVQFSPRNLQSGNYELKVQANDGSNNLAGDQEYNIRFQVIRESTITHFYPYPNPFTTNMRFVFTLTGVEPPDYVKITIMTVSGKIVREITTEELGPMQIGNNISQFTWDGTDMYGDKLANGVYLYKVTARLKGEEIKLRETSADGSFIQGVGKIYILR